MLIDIRFVQMAFAFLRAKVAKGEQGGYPGVSLVIGRKCQKAWTIDQFQSAGRNNSYPRFFCRNMGPYDPRESIPVGNGNRAVTIRRCLLNHFFRMRSSAKEAEVGGDL